MKNIDIYIEQLANVIRDRRVRPITDLEVSIIKLLFKGMTYYEMSLELKYAEGTISDTAMNLFKIFSTHFKYPVRKNTFIYFCQSQLGVAKCS